MPRKKNADTEEYGRVFPRHLRELMQEKNITQQTLADQIDKTRQSVGYYMDGSSSPDWKTLADIARFLNVSSDYLLGLSEVRTTDENQRGICEKTGLSEEAVSSLLIHKRNLDMNDGNHKIVQSWSQSALLFLSAIIESNIWWGIMDNINDIVAVRNNGVTEEQAAIFGNDTNALRYYELNLHDILSDFIDEFAAGIEIDEEELCFDLESE